MIPVSIPFSQHLHTLRRLATLPSAQLVFERGIEPDNVPATYRYYTQPHPKYKIIQHKSWGAALIDLHRFGSLDDYLEHVKGRNGAAHHARRARARGYVLTEIDRNAHVDAIHEINTAIGERQGRPMDQTYLSRRSTYERLANFHHFGVFNSEGKLMAYADLGRFGNFDAFSRLIGYRNNDGFMHMLVVDIIARLLRERRVRYLMYDTFFGALPGLQHFKTILGFAPYRAKYSLQ
jgi:hypothetical protein